MENQTPQMNLVQTPTEGAKSGVTKKDDQVPKDVQSESQPWYKSGTWFKGTPNVTTKKTTIDVGTKSGYNLVLENKCFTNKEDDCKNDENKINPYLFQEIIWTDKYGKNQYDSSKHDTQIRTKPTESEVQEWEKMGMLEKDFKTK